MAITIGELVAKLRIDYDDFTKGQRKLVRGAETAAKNIEQHYEDLGIQSSRHLDLMREKARRNFAAIANNAERKLHDVERAYAAMTARLAALDKMQFGPKTAVSQDLQKAYKGLGMRSSADIEADKKQIQEYYDRVAQAAGYNTAEILRAEQAKNAQLAALDKERLAHQVAAQKQAAAATDAAAKEMASAYKTLGMRSNAEFDAMRQNVEKAYQQVVAGAKGSQDQIVKANEARAAQLAKIDEMQFGKQQSIQDQMAAAAKEKAATIASAYKTLGMRGAAEFDTMRKQAVSAYETIAASAGDNTQEILRAEQAKNARLAQIDEMQYGKRISASQQAAQQMAASFQTLGIRSSAEIEAMRQNINKAYQNIANSATSSKEDILRAEKAKTAAMKRLHAEQMASQNNVFSRIKTGAAMVLGHAVTQFTLLAMAVHAVLRKIAMTITSTFKTGFQAMADYEIAVASLAAMVVTFTQRPAGKSQAEYWQDAVRYAEGMIPVLENIAAKTLMTGEQVTALANAFARVGVFLDPANAPQMEAFTALANALPILTRGQEIMKQINTEIRALTQGTNMATSMLLTTLHALDPLIKKHIVQWREQNTVLENMGKMLHGFIPASELLAEQWQAIKNALTTVWKQTLRGGMLGTYKEIIATVKELTAWIGEHRTQISQGLAVAWAVVFTFVERIWIVLKQFGPVFSQLLHELYVVASVWVKIEKTINNVSTHQKGLIWQAMQWAKYLWNAWSALSYMATLDFSRAKASVDEMQKNLDAIYGNLSQKGKTTEIDEWTAAWQKAGIMVKTLEMDVGKAYQAIGKGALGVRDSLKQATEAFSFTLPSDVDYQIATAQQTFEKASKDFEKIIAASSYQLNALNTAWAEGNRGAVDAILRGMYENANWTAMELGEVLDNTREHLKDTIQTAVQDLEGLRQAYKKNLEELRSKTLLGQAFRTLDFQSAIGAKDKEQEIKAAYDLIITTTKAQLERAGAELALAEATYQSQAISTAASFVSRFFPSMLSDVVSGGLEAKRKELQERVAALQKDLADAPAKLQAALDNLYGKGKKGPSGGGGKSEAQRVREEWERTAESLNKDIRYAGIEGLKLDLMEIADRVKELRAMPGADMDLIKQWESSKTLTAMIKDATDMYDPILEKNRGMEEASRQSFDLIAQMAEEARWKEIEGLAKAGNAYKEFRKATTEEEKDRIRDMILNLGTWQEAQRIAFLDYGDTASRVGENVYYTTYQALSNTADVIAGFCATGKADFGDLAQSIIRDLTRIYIESQILGPIAQMAGEGNWLTKALGAVGIISSSVGAAFSGGLGSFSSSTPTYSPDTYAAKGAVLPASTNLTNSILTKPTLIPFASGGVLAGEAGKEAVLPLTRTGRGNLGVEATGMGGGVEINIYEAPGTRAKVEQTGPNSFNVLVEQIEASIASRGELGQGLIRSLDSRYRRNNR